MYLITQEEWKMLKIISQLPPSAFWPWIKKHLQSKTSHLVLVQIDLICSAPFKQIRELSGIFPDLSSFDSSTQIDPNFSFIFPYIDSKIITYYFVADWYAKLMFTLVWILSSRMTAGKLFLFVLHFYFYIRSCATVITVVSKQLFHHIMWVSFSYITEFSFRYS